MLLLLLTLANGQMMGSEWLFAAPRMIRRLEQAKVSGGFQTQSSSQACNLTAVVLDPKFNLTALNPCFTKFDQFACGGLDMSVMCQAGGCVSLFQNLLQVLVNHGCALTDLGKCTQDSNCDSDQACYMNKCEKRCTNTSDCNACNKEICMSLTSGAKACVDPNADPVSPLANSIYLFSQILCSNDNGKYCADYLAILSQDTIPSCDTLASWHCCSGTIMQFENHCSTGINGTTISGHLITTCTTPYVNQTCPGVQSAADCCKAGNTNYCWSQPNSGLMLSPGFAMFAIFAIFALIKF